MELAGRSTRMKRRSEWKRYWDYLTIFKQRTSSIRIRQRLFTVSYATDLASRRRSFERLRSTKGMRRQEEAPSSWTETPQGP